MTACPRRRATHCHDLDRAPIPPHTRRARTLARARLPKPIFRLILEFYVPRDATYSAAYAPREATWNF